MSTEQSGQIITFYSYKGGTGRTMALANTACLLARELSGSASKPNDTARVLAIDWDFEAPGLHRFFQPYLTAESQEAFAAKPGCIDLFVALERHKQEFKHDDVVGNRQRARALLAAMNFREYILDTRIPGLAFIKSGRFGPDYAEIVSSFNWEAFFHETIGLFAGFTDFLREQFAYVLIDSRTGVTDTSGICTMLLPDKLVTVFTPNRQSLSGLDELIHKAISYRRNSDDWRPLVVFPLPSRIEMARPQLFELWRRGKGVTSRPLMRIDGLFDVFLSHTGKDKPAVRQLAQALQARGLRVWLDEEQLVPGRPWQKALESIIEKTHTAAVLIGKDGLGPWEIPEMRACLSEFVNRHLPVIPVLLPNAPAEPELPLFLLSFTWVDLRGGLTENGLNRLEWGITGVKPGKSLGSAEDKLSPWAGEDKGYQPLFEELFRELYELEKCDLTSYFDQVLLQHIPDYAYGEPIAVELEAGEERIFLRSAYRAFLEQLIELPLPWLSLEDVRNERMISLQCDEALTKLQQGATDDTLRLGLVLLDKAATEPVFDKFFDTLLKLGEAAFRTNPSLAQSIVSGAINHAERLLVQDPGALAEKMAEAAQLYYRCGQFAGAQDLWQRVLDIYRKDIGEEHPQTLAAMNGLAETLRAQGNYVKARELHERVLAVRRHVLGGEHPDTLQSMNNLALTLEAQGDLDGARALQEQTSAVSHRVLGAEHSNTLTSMNNLAATLRAQGDLGRARALQEQALAVLRRVLGNEHPDTLQSINNLAETLRAQGDLVGARALQEQALAVLRRVLGEEHPATLQSMNNLAETLRAQGDLDGARALQEQALAVLRRVLGEEHPATLQSMNNLAATLQAQWDLGKARALHAPGGWRARDLYGVQEDLDRARALHERVLAVLRRMLGEEHPDTLTLMNNLAATLQAQGDLGGARALHEQVLAIRRRMLGEEHPDTLTSMNNLATTLEAQGDLGGARALHERVLEISQRVLCEEHPNTLTSMNNLATTLEAQGDLGGARALFERVLEVSQRVLGKEHPNTLAAMSNLAEILGGQGDLVGARQLQEQALELKRQVLGEKHPDTLATMNSLLETMKAQGDENAARELQERLLSLYQQAFGKARSETGSVSELQTLKR